MPLCGNEMMINASRRSFLLAMVGAVAFPWPDVSPEPAPVIQQVDNHDLRCQILEDWLNHDQPGHLTDAEFERLYESAVEQAKMIRRLKKMAPGELKYVKESRAEPFGRSRFPMKVTRKK